MTVILGAGAFGTALAVALSARGPVTLIARDASWAGARVNPRLPGVVLPDAVTVTDAAHGADAPVLLAVPMQALGGVLKANAGWLDGRTLVACCK
ncbi:MAG: NAD(P)-binding domain-containing protein, partial [Gemmobacter sp.]|nr:NAD(P)-binding domain-containing protein [Gemmobacter sp.]